MHKPFNSIRRRAQKLAAPMMSLAGLALLAAPSTAQAQAGGSCNNDWQCRSASGWDEISWCHQGNCVDIDRRSPECIQPARFCFADFMCSDGNANTVTWCEFTDWSWFGQCHAAPRDGGGTCDPDAGGQACLINKDCRDGDPRTKNWCHRGTCVEADRDDASCRDEGQNCRRNWQCRDGDPNTKDWCYMGTCYNAPNDTGVCEGGSQCDPADCPDDNNECTRAACDDNEQCLQENIVGICDGGNGTCDDGTCVPNPPNCDPASCPNDGNECTMAACDGDVCIQQNLVGDACDDGGGTCQDGSCVANPPTCDPATCPSDDNECTQAACVNDACAQEKVTEGQSCSDGTGTCQAGNCVLNPPTCDPATCPNDGNACTQAVCLDNACAQEITNNGGECNDGAGTCNEGVCVNDCVASECPNDGNDCTEAACDNNACVQQNLSGTSCAGGSGECVAGTCSVCVDSECDDTNECTQDACNGAACEFTPVADNIECANGDGLCKSGTCDVCEDSECDDGNECTQDACNGAACEFTPVAQGQSCNGGAGVCSDAGECVDCINDDGCSDGVACNGTETCVDNACVAGADVDCTPPNECQVGECSEPGGDCSFTNVPNNTQCGEDGGLCVDGACTVCDPNSCDDGNECTEGSCNALNVCENIPVNDGASCNGGGGQCLTGNCVECVADADCNAGNACVQADSCVNNQCQAGDPVVCPDDGNVCTASACDPVNGCSTSNVPDGTSCGNAGETCQAGVCEGVVQPPDCEPITVVIEHRRRGAVNRPGSGNKWKVISNSYQIRSENDLLSGQDVPLTSNYHCFDLSAVPSGQIVSAELELSHSENSYDSPDPSETVAFREITQANCNTDFSNPPLNAPTNYQQIFDDLNSGSIVAEASMSLTNNGPNEQTPRAQRFPVNAAAFAGIQAKLGSSAEWGIGGSLTTGDGASAGAIERVFRGTDESAGTIWPSALLTLTIKPDSCGSNQTVLTADDVGYFLKATRQDTGATIQSFHFQSASSDAHKSLFVGNLNLERSSVRIDIERRSYTVWDVSNVNNAVSGKLRVWGWQRATANNYSGAYFSEDPSEIVGLFPVSTPADQIINAPYQVVAPGDIDDTIFDDLGTLGSGQSSFGERVYTPNDRITNLAPAFRAPVTTVCDPEAPIVRDADGNIVSAPQAPCGKWLEFDLTQAAINAINSTDGQLTIGKAMTTISGDNDKQEWTNNGVIVDMSEANGQFPAFLSPNPQLILRTN